jgi:hypothetical protein|nr:MAG TPA: Protein of unknown function (DUF1351) [Caudoviricetes sp.]
MDNALQVITLKQLPIIEEHLQLVKSDVETRTRNAMQLVCTEETRKDVKSIRTELSKEFAEMENQRKRVKDAIMNPYNQFEAVYKECIFDPYKKADAELKKRIDEVESGLKSDKEKAIRDYFSELCKANNLPWLRFEQMNLKIGLSTSVNGVKTTLTATVLKIAEEVQELSLHEDAAELLVEYKKSLNMALALSTIRARQEQIELQKQYEAQRRAALEQQRAAEEKVQQAVSEAQETQQDAAEPPIEEVTAPTEETPTEAPTAVQEQAPAIIYEVKFAVRGTIAQLKKLKQFIIQEGMSYDDI